MKAFQESQIKPGKTRRDVKSDDIPQPDVPAGKWESAMWSKLDKSVRMEYYQQLIDRQIGWADVWKMINNRKNYDNNMEYIVMGMGLQTTQEVTPSNTIIDKYLNITYHRDTIKISRTKN